MVQYFFLGFGHEHTRADRDNHVIVDMSAIQSGWEGNFKIIPHQDWDSLGTRYETGSGLVSNLAFSFVEVSFLLIG